jgi:hypothetical protein
LLTAILGCLGSALTIIWKLTVAAYRLISQFRNKHIDIIVFQYIKTTKSVNGTYNIEEIAETLRRSKQQISQSLDRLGKQNKVRCYGDVWALHELER